MLDQLKNWVRTWEARLTPRRSEICFRDRTLYFHRSLWWVNETAENFVDEIEPYFAAIQDSARQYRGILDAGAATGLFAVAAAAAFPKAELFLFEPALRQRVLLQRNLELNGISRGSARIVREALWNENSTAPFRTIGAMSSIESVSHLKDQLEFQETVPTTTLDAWCEQVQPACLDLIKMDIEGAEIEALQGALKTLRRFRPELLIMAYHERDGTRTFDRCAGILAEIGYDIRERTDTPGFLHAV